ncbi:MAG: hypothetical protein JWO78_2041 [Micavibrio sp.]|nr:hypothetical protein [Micavibrio sp.]
MGTDILFSSTYQADQALFSQLSRMEDVARVAVADIDEE